MSAVVVHSFVAICMVEASSAFDPAIALNVIAKIKAEKENLVFDIHFIKIQFCQFGVHETFINLFLSFHL